jgi:transcriptional regulator with XRE-family HTH domain
MNLGQRIKKLREDKHIRQQELAERAGISVGFLSEIENNHRPSASARVLLKIATALGSTIDYLTTGRVEPQAANPEPVTIPPDLRLAAERANLSFKTTATLAEAYHQIVARRGGGLEKPPTADEWLTMYHVLRRYIEEE